MSKYYKVNDVSRAIIELPNSENGYSGSYDKAEILNAFEDLPTIEVSEDCVDRYSVLAELDPRSYEYKAVKELSSVIPQSKEGEWLFDVDEVELGTEQF